MALRATNKVSVWLQVFLAIVLYKKMMPVHSQKLVENKSMCEHRPSCLARCCPRQQFQLLCSNFTLPRALQQHGTLFHSAWEVTTLARATMRMACLWLFFTCTNLPGQQVGWVLGKENMLSVWFR